MTDLHWSFQVDPPAADVAELREELVRHYVHASDIAQSKDLAVFIHDSSGKLIGGVTGNLWGSVLEIDFLWLHANLRAAGLGKQIISRLEQEARMRGCSVAFLNTFSFQAPDFYKKMGFQVLDVIEGYPGGVKKYFCKKSLA